MKRGRLADAQRFAVLAAAYPKERRRVDNGDVGAYRTKVVQAGEFMYISCYPLISTGRAKAQDAMLNDVGRQSREAARRFDKFNNARRTVKFEQLVHANFVQGDLHVTLTYALENFDLMSREDWESAYLHTREAAKREIANWMRAVKRLLVRHGCDLSEFRWIKVTVTKEGDRETDKRPDRHHHHVLLHGVPEALRGEVERLWPYGTCNADRLQYGDAGLAAMAGYVARQEGSQNGNHRQMGERGYSCSRNIIRPAERVSDVRISRRRVAQIANDVRRDGVEILERIWRGYRVTELPRVLISDFCAGAYIYARMRRRGGKAT